MTDLNIDIHWEHFEKNAHNTFINLWNDQGFADVTLATVDDQQIRAHKVILGSCSEFFRNIFLKNPHQNLLLYLKDIRYKELALVMKFIYLGQCEVRQSELENFLSTGNDLKVGGLMEDVNLKDIEEPLVENGTHKIQESQESGSNYTDLDDTSWEMSPQENYKEVILPSNQQKGGKFVCSECNAGFGTKQGLSCHKSSKHEGVRYNCDQCENTFTQQSMVTLHKQSKHKGVRYNCDQCHSTFTWQQKVTRHKQSKTWRSEVSLQPVWLQSYSSELSD